MYFREPFCEVTNEENGEKIKVLCSATIPPTTKDEVAALLGAENDNTTLAGNATKHCSKTEFGCCSDWYTAAEGTDYKGCPTFVLGNFLNI